MSNKFYTNIVNRGNYVLYRGYEDGLPVQRKIDYKPHLFTDDANGKYKLFNSQKKLRKKTFDSIVDMKQYVEQFKGVDNFGVYGCSDIVRQFTAEYFTGEINWDYNLAQIYLLDIETEVGSLHPVVDENIIVTIRDLNNVETTCTVKELCSYDDTPYTVYDNGNWKQVHLSSYVKRLGFPEPKDALERISLITCICRNTDKVHMWSLHVVSDNSDVIDDNVVFRSFDDDERKMLKDFIMWFASTRIDIISGWNSEIFDVPYIVNRIKKLFGDKVALLLSPWKEVKERIIRYDNGETAQTYDIIGITHLDYLVIYKKFNPGSQESFKLAHIAYVELGESKVENPCDSFKEFYTGTYEVKTEEEANAKGKFGRSSYNRFLIKKQYGIDSPQWIIANKIAVQDAWDLFTKYNKQDAMLLLKMEKTLLQIRLAMQLGYLAKCQFADVMSAMRLWESIIYNHFNDNGIVEYLNKKHNERHSIVGAYVHDPVPGRYGWTVSIDATSLYPSIIMQNNISPECIIRYEDINVDDFIKTINDRTPIPGEIISANGLVTNKMEGFIPFLVKRMFELRKQTKNLMLDKKKEEQALLMTKYDPVVMEKLMADIAALDVAQSAQKIAANSLFGITGLPHFKYYDYRLAEAITSSGQLFIKQAKIAIDDVFTKLCGQKTDYALYLDTDSCYINCSKIVEQKWPNLSHDEIVNKLEQLTFKIIQPAVNDSLNKIVRNMGVDDCKISFKLECIGPSIVFVAKKRYAFDILYSEGVRYKEPKMKVMGIEIVRSSTPSIVKDYLKECLALCLRSNENTLQSKVLEVKQLFMTQSYENISFPRGCNGMSTYASVTSIYQRGNGLTTPIHVRAALLYNYHLIKNGLQNDYQRIHDGEKIKFVYLKMPNTIHENVIGFIDKIPDQLGVKRFIDYNKQWDAAFIAPLTKITDAIGWEIEKKVTLDMGF